MSNGAPARLGGRDEFSVVVVQFQCEKARFVRRADVRLD